LKYQISEGGVLFVLCAIALLRKAYAFGLNKTEAVQFSAKGEYFRFLLQREIPLSELFPAFIPGNVWQVLSPPSSGRRCQVATLAERHFISPANIFAISGVIPR